MNSKQSFYKPKFTHILLAILLSATTICHAAMKPRIDPNALAKWQQNVARIVWTAKNMSPYEINGLIKRMKPPQEELFENFAAITSKKEAQPDVVAGIKDQDIRVTQALEAFTNAQNAENGSDQLKSYIETFENQFNQLDEENLVGLAKQLGSIIDDELQILEKKTTQYQPTIKYCSKFFSLIRILTQNKFQTRSKEATAKIRQLMDLKAQLAQGLTGWIEENIKIDNEIIAIKKRLNPQLNTLLSQWKEGNPTILIDIVMDSESLKRLYATTTDEVYRTKFFEIEKNKGIARQLEELNKQYKEKSISEKQIKKLQDQLAQIDLKKEFYRQELGEKYPAYAALSKLVEQLEQLDQRQKKIQNGPQSAKIEPATAPQQAPKKSSFLDSSTAQLAYGDKAFKAFTDALSVETGDMNTYLQIFETNFLKLDDKNIIGLTKKLINKITMLTQSLEQKTEYIVNVESGEAFLSKIKSLLEQKFETQLKDIKDLNTQISRHQTLISQLEKQVEAQKKLIVQKQEKLKSEMDTRIRVSFSETSKEHGTLLWRNDTQWNPENQKMLVDIATKPEFMDLLAAQKNDKYAKKWEEIKKNEQLIDFFTAIRTEIAALEKASKQLEDKPKQQKNLLLNTSKKLKEFQDQLQKNPVYTALINLNTQFEKLIETQKSIMNQEKWPSTSSRQPTRTSPAQETQAQEEQEQQESSKWRERKAPIAQAKSVVAKQGSTMAIPTRRASTSKQEQQESEEGPEGQESWRTKGFTWQASPNVLKGIK